MVKKIEEVIDTSSVGKKLEFMNEFEKSIDRVISEMSDSKYIVSLKFSSEEEYLRQMTETLLNCLVCMKEKEGSDASSLFLNPQMSSNPAMVYCLRAIIMTKVYKKD